MNIPPELIVLQTVEKISAEYPSAIVREGGLNALLNYLPFFSTNVQRTAVTAAANCCRNISGEHFEQIRTAFPTLRDTLTLADQRLVEQATLAVVRTIESFRHNAEHLERLLDLPTVVAINALLMPSGGSPLLSPPTYTHLLRALTTSARGSAKVTIAFLEAGMTNTVYQILTGVLPSSHADDEQGAALKGQGVAGGIADMAVLQNLAHRPKDQVEESLALICELLPPLPKDGVFDPKSYTEKSLAKIKKGRKIERSDRLTRRSSRTGDAVTPIGSAGPSTPMMGGPSALPGADTPTPTAGPPASVLDAIARAKKDADHQTEQRITLLKSRPELLGKFIKAIVPILVDVYAASVASRVRSKVLIGLVKAIASAEKDDLKDTLKVRGVLVTFFPADILQSVPLASFLCAIIASKDDPTFVLNALQLVELLATKLPDVYQTSFVREGVVFEIEALAEQELSSVKAATKEATDAAVKTEAEEQATPTAGPSTSAVPALTSDETKPILPTAGLPSALSSFLIEPGPGISTHRRSISQLDPTDAIIIRARLLAAKKLFDVGGDHKDAASMVLNELGALVRRLCVSDASEAELRDSLRDIASQFSNAGPALSSFELLKSGLVDGLLDFVDINGTVSSSERRAMLFDIFSDSTLSSPAPLTMLVKRLHESLGRLESFEVETAFNGVGDSMRPSSSSLSRTIRIRLQAEEGQDIPRHVSALSITIQAIAPMQALHDYLRPRIADGNFGSSLSNIFAAYASGMPIPRAGSGAASRILSALAGPGGDAGGSGEPLGAPIASSAPDSSSRLDMLPPAGAEPEDQSPKPQRRRSARLSGQGVTDPSAAAAVDPSNGPTLSSSAPERSILPAMPMDMDFDDDDYSDEEYDAEVSRQHFLSPC